MLFVPLDSFVYEALKAFGGFEAFEAIEAGGSSDGWGLGGDVEATGREMREIERVENLVPKKFRRGSSKENPHGFCPWMLV